MNKRHLKTLLIEDVEKTIDTLLGGNISDQHFDSLILIKARKQDLDRSISHNVLPQIEINIELNKIRGSIMYLINSFDEDETFKIDQEQEKHDVEGEIESLDAEIFELGDTTEHMEIAIFLEESEYGIIDIEELLFEKTDEFTENIRRMTEITAELGAGISTEARRLDKVNESSSPNRRSLQKGIINNAAKVMRNYMERMKIEIPIFEDTTQLTIRYSMLYISKIYENGLEENLDDISNYKEALGSLLESAIVSRTALTKMCEEIKKVRNLTSYFGLIKRKVLGQLKSFFEIYDIYISDLTSLNESVRLMNLELRTEEE